MYRVIESESDVYYILQEQRSKRRDCYLIIKIRITLTGINYIVTVKIIRNEV